MSVVYVHGYDDIEADRLADQAASLADLLHGDIQYSAGQSVLEVGCGVGAQTIGLAGRSPEARFTSVDVSPDSVEIARSRVTEAGLDNVTIQCADARALPFAVGSFDHVFVCFVLEHIPDPVHTLRTIAEHVRSGGSVTLIEGDHGSTFFHPRSDAARAAIDSMTTLQERAGGDPYIGRALWPIMRDAGLGDVTVLPRTVYIDGSSPELAESYVRRTYLPMIAGAEGPVVAAGLIDRERFRCGVADLARTAEQSGVFTTTYFVGSARA